MVTAEGRQYMANGSRGGQPPPPKVGYVNGWLNSDLDPATSAKRQLDQRQNTREAQDRFPVGTSVKTPLGAGKVVEIKKHGAVIVRVGRIKKSFSHKALERA